MVEKTYYESRPSWKVLIGWTYGEILGAIGSFLILNYWILPWLYPEWGTTGLNLWGLGIDRMILIYLFVGGSLINIVYSIFLRKSYLYKITNEGIYLKSGIFNKTEKFAPFFKITDIRITQSLKCQILGISELAFQTAGGSMAEIIFEGIENAEKPKQLVYQFMKKSRKSS